MHAVRVLSFFSFFFPFEPKIHAEDVDHNVYLSEQMEFMQQRCYIFNNQIFIREISAVKVYVMGFWLLFYPVLGNLWRGSPTYQSTSLHL
jgi:hypothetical protein